MFPSPGDWTELWIRNTASKMNTPSCTRFPLPPRQFHTLVTIVANAYLSESIIQFSNQQLISPGPISATASNRPFDGFHSERKMLQRNRHFRVYNSERERERECVCVCACVRAKASKSEKSQTYTKTNVATPTARKRRHEIQNHFTVHRQTK